MRKFSLFILMIIFSAAGSTCLKIARDECDEPAPDAVTDAVSFITSEGAVLNGKVAPHGQKTIVTFDLGENEAYSKTVEIFNSPVSEISYRPVTVQVTGLFPSTTYHYRLKASGECKETFGEDLSFTTLKKEETGLVFNPEITYGTVSDIDDNTYKTVTIGTQTWMAENLRVQRLNDGSGMVNDINNHSWVSRTTPVYCFYNNYVMSRFAAGNLYNWYAVGTGKLCPAGWHVPGEAEWNTLIAYLGNGAAGKLKMTGINMWAFPNTLSTNETGFTAIPTGFRYGYIDSKGGQFYELGLQSYWWTSTETSTTTARYRAIDNSGSVTGTDQNPGKYLLNNKNFGFSVRCIKN